MEQIQIKSVSVTELLLERLFKAPDLKTYMKDNADLMEMPPFGPLITGLCKKAGIPKARIIDRSDIPATMHISFLTTFAIHRAIR